MSIPFTTVPPDAANFFDTFGHFGLIRGQMTSVFCAENEMLFSDDQLPPVDLTTLPESMGVRAWLQVENQGGQGSCQGHARTSVEELAIYRETRGQIVQLNRQFAYITSQMVDGLDGRDQGSTIEGGASASKKYGSCLESIWPYEGRYTTRIPQACFPDAETRKLRTFAPLRSYDQVLRWLVHGVGGIVIGIGWNQTCEPGANGTIRRYRSGGGGHALALVDWNRKFVDGGGRPFISMANSWGRGWGYEGWAWVDPQVIEHWCDNETVIGYSDMDGPGITPRGFDWINGRVAA